MEKLQMLQEFAKTHFENVIYARFDKDKILRNIFAKDFDLRRIGRADGGVNGAHQQAVP